MIGVFVPRLARSYGRDPSVAFVLAVLNPLVLLHLIAGAHNDALMLGFLLAGLWLAREGRPVVGVLLCTIGAMIKIPAFVGVVYIGWGWLGDDVSWRSRLRPTVMATGLGLVSHGGGVADGRARVGLGDGAGQQRNGQVLERSSYDRSLVRSEAGGAARAREPSAGAPERGERPRAGCCAAAVAVRLLWRAREATAMRAMGLTLLAVVFLGPAVQPWYVAWSMVVLATIAEHRLRVL